MTSGPSLVKPQTGGQWQEEERGVGVGWEGEGASLHRDKQSLKFRRKIALVHLLRGTNPRGFDHRYVEIPVHNVLRRRSCIHLKS